MAYATVDEVCATFPTFQRAAVGSIADTQITKWIDDWAARIDSALLQRGVNLATFVPSTRQANFLRGLNKDGGAADLYDALNPSISLVPSTMPIGSEFRRSAERRLKEIAEGEHDTLFGVETKGTKFGGIGGAETTVDETPEDRGENRSFGKNQEF